MRIRGPTVIATKALRSIYIGFCDDIGVIGATTG
jgi:hypothetical protein